ncbi:MAG: 16S rRNA (cytidine(1402)-2'-O)-methyltransferase [Candidatus Krumholzibacteriia bacterium]
MAGLTLPSLDFPPGACLFVATPIGNLDDMTLRGLAALAAADTVYAEDTRRTRRLLARYELPARLVSYHDHSRPGVVEGIVARLRAGERVVVVSDAGTPAISDPGFTLLRALRAAGLPWSTVPGPSSVLAALLLAGFPTDRFLFAGYPPRRPGAARRFLRTALDAGCTTVVLESCHRARATLGALAELAPAREVALVREITKVHEETLRGTAAQVLEMMTGPRLKGELVLVLRGGDGADDTAPDDPDGE